MPDLFEPLRNGTRDRPFVIGQIGQSLDGRIATTTGDSKYVNGDAGLTHLHQLRALVDVVVIGVGTALADDPQLTVRRVAGSHPARVVIDPRGRLPAEARLLAADGVRRIVVVEDGTCPDVPDGVEIQSLPTENRQIAPAAILDRLGTLGFRRILVEGGADTISRFLAAGCLDRLHVIVSPLIVGSGHNSFSLPPIARMGDALRPPTHAHILDGDIVFDCDLSAQRMPAGCAKKST